MHLFKFSVLGYKLHALYALKVAVQGPSVKATPHVYRFIHFGPAKITLFSLFT
jgi:hypothetical protein